MYEFRDINNLFLTINGYTTGGKTTFIWTRNGGNPISPSKTMIRVGDGLLYIWGAEFSIRGSCENTIYRYPLLVGGRLPGIYQLNATNDKTRTPFRRFINIQGENV